MSHFFTRTKTDPLTGRKICDACWNGVHGSCDGYPDCDCVHLEEAEDDDDDSRG